MNNKEKFNWLQTLTIGFGVASIGILLAVIGLILVNQ